MVNGEGQIENSFVKVNGEGGETGNVRDKGRGEGQWRVVRLNNGSVYFEERCAKWRGN